jgi:hypothetical protein
MRGIVTHGPLGSGKHVPFGHQEPRPHTHFGSKAHRERGRTYHIKKPPVSPSDTKVAAVSALAVRHYDAFVMKRKHVGQAGFWLSLGMLVSGCFSRTAITYPSNWQPTVAVHAATCPQIAGRYVNLGEIAQGTQPAQCSVGGRRGPSRGEWSCDTTLSNNVADITTGDWLELRQPDDDTLIAVSSDPAVDVQQMHRSKGDFTCSAKGLERRIHASMTSIGNNSAHPPAAADAYNAFATVATMMYASGGVNSLTRSFNVAADGALVMSVSQSTNEVLLLIPLHERKETFVRWERAPLTSSGTTGDLPSAHVGLFDSMNGWPHHVRVASLDGNPVNANESKAAVPIALEPGQHWIEVKQDDHHLTPPRDFDTVYGFEMIAMAGRRYRLDRRQPPCFAPGNIDQALASQAVYHARVTIIDEANGVAAPPLDVDALCVSGWTFVCDASQIFPDGQSKGLACVRLEGSNHGFYGRVAGPAR